MKKCLLITTKDKRKYLTHEKYFPQLIEFSKTFNAEISVVKLEGGEPPPPLELEDLAPALCDNNYKGRRFDYEVLETKIAQENRPRKKILRDASRIKRYIISRFQMGQVVSLKELRKKFRRYGLTPAALCNHVRRAKAELNCLGYEFIKSGAGEYQAKKEIKCQMYSNVSSAGF